MRSQLSIFCFFTNWTRSHKWRENSKKLSRNSEKRSGGGRLTLEETQDFGQIREKSFKGPANSILKMTGISKYGRHWVIPPVNTGSTAYPSIHSKNMVYLAVPPVCIPEDTEYSLYRQHQNLILLRTGTEWFPLTMLTVVSIPVFSLRKLWVFRSNRRFLVCRDTTWSWPEILHSVFACSWWAYYRVYIDKVHLLLDIFFRAISRF